MSPAGTTEPRTGILDEPDFRAQDGRNRGHGKLAADHAPCHQEIAVGGIELVDLAVDISPHAGRNGRYCFGNVRRRPGLYELVDDAGEEERVTAGAGEKLPGDLAGRCVAGTFASLSSR